MQALVGFVHHLTVISIPGTFLATLGPSLGRSHLILLSPDSELVLQVDKVVDELALLRFEEVVDAVDLVQEGVHPLNCEPFSLLDRIISLIRLHVRQVTFFELRNKIYHFLKCAFLPCHWEIS